MLDAFRLKVFALAIALVCLMPSSVPATETILVLGQQAPAAGVGVSATCTNASPAVCTVTGSNLAVNDQWVFTGGTQPTGFSLNTVYYVIAGGLTANNFELSATQGGSAINSSSTGSAIVGTFFKRLYTPSGSNAAVVSTIVVSNNSAVADSFRIAVVPAAGAVAAKSYIAYGTPVPGNDSILVTLGITLANTDQIFVTTTNGTSAFNAFGAETN